MDFVGLSFVSNTYYLQCSELWEIDFVFILRIQAGEIFMSLSTSLVLLVRLLQPCSALFVHFYSSQFLLLTYFMPNSWDFIHVLHLYIIWDVKQV